MLLKILNWLGLIACLMLVISCLMPWAYFADVKENFTGFYSYHNQYGKPGKMLVSIALIVFILMILPKVWAKRTNLFVSALGVGYAIKSYILYVSCYNAYCPERKLGIYLMLFSSIIMLIATIFPDVKLKSEIKD
jgi:hypothetical protein